ncbi:MAG: DUF1116 domain-containing protein [Actinomycetota bacterium]
MAHHQSSHRVLALPDEVRAVNVGLPVFGEALRAQGAEAVDVDWRIPAGGDPDLVAALSRLYGPAALGIERANAEVIRRLDEGVPLLVGVAAALDAVPGMEERTVLHPGPPLPWERLCDPLARSVKATVLAEGWAFTPEEAGSLVARGGVRLEPANHHGAVLPMATALGPSAPVWVVEHSRGNNRAYSGINQGPGAAAWFGMDAPEAVRLLTWLREVALPVFRATLASSGPVDLWALAAQGLQMGDDVHMRCQASTNLLIRHLLPHLVAVNPPGSPAVARFLSRNHLFFLNLAMAGAKAVTDWAGEVSGSSVVVSMSRNGTTFGIRLAGMADRWFVSAAPDVGDALFYPGFGSGDAAPDIGDSAVLELVGLGGAATAASPMVASFLGGTMVAAVEGTEGMDRMCVARSTRFKIPYLDLRGAPVGVDVRKAVELQVTPNINTGILHASSGRGQIGAGVARAPAECFRQALMALDAALG